MDFLRLANWNLATSRDFSVDSLVPSNTDYEDLGMVLQDAHLRRDIARRPDLTPFVRDDSAKAA